MTIPDPEPWTAEEGYRRLRLCSGGGGFEAVPVRSVVLDLLQLRQRLEHEGVTVLDARVVLIVSMEVEVSVSRNGRLMFKTADERLANRAFHCIVPLLRPVGRR